MMFLMNTIQAEVEPVPGQDGWFQLTGKKIQREGMDPTDLLGDLAAQEALIPGAKLLGVHDVDEEIVDMDPRFNDEEQPGFGVTQEQDGTFTAYLACNRAEYAFFRFLVPMAGGEEMESQYDPLNIYRK